MSPDFLETILAAKRRELARAKRAVREQDLRELAESLAPRRPFLDKLAEPGPFGANIIAEIKRASPSRGAIRTHAEADAQARSYESGGAVALSVLTEGGQFMGSPEDLRQARAATSLPVLRKDFIISAYQIYESLAMGADAVLLIVRALPRGLLRDLIALCAELGTAALVEVHSERELETASTAGARLIGINNRDLRTFETDIRRCLRIGRYLDPSQIGVAESGIRERDHVEKLLSAGFWNFLIGESLMKAPDPEAYLRHLLGRDS